MNNYIRQDCLLQGQAQLDHRVVFRFSTLCPSSSPLQNSELSESRSSKFPALKSLLVVVVACLIIVSSQAQILSRSRLGCSKILKNVNSIQASWVLTGGKLHFHEYFRKKIKKFKPLLIKAYFVFPNPTEMGKKVVPTPPPCGLSLESQNKDLYSFLGGQK